MPYASGTVTPTFGSAIYEFAVQLPEGSFLVSNGDEHLTPEDVGKEVIVSYTTQDQFCKVIPTPLVCNLLNLFKTMNNPE